MSSPLQIHSISSYSQAHSSRVGIIAPGNVCCSRAIEQSRRGKALRMSAPLNKVLMCVIIRVCPSMHPFQTSALLSGRSRVD